MAPTVLNETSILLNPLAAAEQLESSGSRLDGVPRDLEDSVRYAGARLTQMAGILLRLPQDVIAQAIVIFTRFWIGSEGGSMSDYGAKEVSAASLYLMAKLSAYPKSPRSILNVYAYLDSLPKMFMNPSKLEDTCNPDAFYLTEGQYQTQRTQLTTVEANILRIIGFQTHVALPYTLCINYLQTLSVTGSSLTAVAKRAFAHLNSTLLSPQLLYLTHQPPSLATSAIYLAAREEAVKLPGVEWWEVFDCDREELGFLVVAMQSMEGFVASEADKWAKQRAPLTVDELQGELKRRKMLEEGE